MRATAFRFLGLTLCLAIVLRAGAAPAPKSEPAPNEIPGVEMVNRALDAKVDIDYANLPLPGAIADLAQAHKLNIVLDRAILLQMGVEPNELIVDIKLKGVKLRKALRALVSPHGLNFVVVDNSIIISTEDHAISRQLKQRVDVDFEQMPLHKAMKSLAQTYGINIVVDPRTLRGNKAAENQISLNLADVPIESAIRLMCELADLKPARLGNIIYVTTQDRAEKLKESDGLMLPSIMPEGNLPAMPVAPPAVPAAPAAPGPAAERR